MTATDDVRLVYELIDEALASEEVDLEELSKRIVKALDGSIKERARRAEKAARKAKYKFAIICQDRQQVLEETQEVEVGRPIEGEPLREALTATLRTRKAFHPTWVLGPFLTKGEASVEARKARAENPDIKVMTAEVFEPGDEIVTSPNGVWI